MELITERDRVRSIAKAWSCLTSDMSRSARVDTIVNKFKALDPNTATIEDVQAIFNTDTKMQCDICGSGKSELVRVPCRESGKGTIDICLKCTDEILICFDPS